MRAHAAHAPACGLLGAAVLRAGTQGLLRARCRNSPASFEHNILTPTHLAAQLRCANSCLLARLGEGPQKAKIFLERGTFALYDSLSPRQRGVPLLTLSPRHLALVRKAGIKLRGGLQAASAAP